MTDTHDNAPHQATLTSNRHRRSRQMLILVAFASATFAALTTLAVIKFVPPWLLCKKDLLCTDTSVQRVPGQIHLSWTEDPSSTMTMTWKTERDDNLNAVEFRPVGGGDWQRATGDAETLPGRRTVSRARCHTQGHPARPDARPTL